MSRHGRSKRDRDRRDFEQALAESADLLGGILDEVHPPAAPDDFLVRELSRILDEGQPSFEDPDFRFLIEQGIRLEYEGRVELRARFVEALRETSMGPATRIRTQVIGALEDIDFPLHRIGAVVRHYTRHLFARLENAEDTGVDGLAPTIDRLFESGEDPAAAAEAIAVLSAAAGSHGRDIAAKSVAARALAHAVSEPCLDEASEERACRALRDTWPAARSYILFHLRKHAHEDIPFRWLELLIETGELRAVDRILEEVLVHGSDAGFREDLLAILGLIGRSPDPGRDGKIARILMGPDSPVEARSVLACWAAPESRVEREDDFQSADFVHLGEDFSSFAARFDTLTIGEVFERWNHAWHESLGWIERSRLPRSDLEARLDKGIQEAIIRQFPGRRPDEANLRDVTESVREARMESTREGTPPLVTIYRERPRGTPWLRDVYLREINALYIQAAQAFDTGDLERSRRKLDLALAVEPEYPLAVVLDRVLRHVSDRADRRDPG